jgi:hypothetical protein
MKNNNVFSEIANIAGMVFRRIKSHVSELLNPETPSYKTSLTVIPLFAIIAFASGDRHSLFWISFACMVFFAVVAIAQYGFFSRRKQATYSSVDSNRQNKF